MGFWEDLLEFGGKVLEAMPEVALRQKIGEKVDAWEEIEDGDDIEDSIKGYVQDSSLEELEITHQVLGQRLKDNVWSDDSFQKNLLIFGCFHRAWGVRDYRRR